MRSERRQRITNKNGKGYIQEVKLRRRVRWKTFKLYDTQTLKNNIYDFTKLSSGLHRFKLHPIVHFSDNSDQFSVPQQ